MRNQRTLIAGAALAAAVAMPGTAPALDKEVSLVTKQPLGDLAVAGRLSVDLHAAFMLSRTYRDETALNWHNCGYSGGGGNTKVGGTFGDFGLHVPHAQRRLRYPHAVAGEVPAVRFDGDDVMAGNFAIEPQLAGAQPLALELWFRDASPAAGEVILGWQSPDGREGSAQVGHPPGFTGSDQWRHLVINCTAESEEWHLDGRRVAGGARKLLVAPGHVMVLGGGAAAKPSFQGELAAVRLHDQAMTAAEIAHNFHGGAMLGTALKNWWRTEPDQWWTAESEHFRHCVDKEEMKAWTPQQLAEFHDRVPRMFDLAELIYHTYSERLALRTSVVSVLPEERGDGIRYKTPIQPSNGSWMGWDGHFGWACQGAGHINPHELAHGWSAMTGNMAGNYWEAFANWPQTHNGVYQTIPVIMAECAAFPASGRTYYHDRLLFEHLAQTPEYGPMFIAKMWYDGPSEAVKDPYPWLTFTRLDPDPATPLAFEHTRMAMRNVTWDYTTYAEAAPGQGNTPHGNDGVASPENLYRKAAEQARADVLRLSRILLERIPHAPGWWRVPKEQAPQQLGWNICPLTASPGTVAATLAGYVNPGRGSAWSAGFVGVGADCKPVYGEVFGPGKPQAFEVTAAMKELYLVVCGTPAKILPIDMVGDFRSPEQEQFPYRVRLAGCEPLDVMVPAPPGVPGAPHPNGGGFVAATAEAAATAFVGPHAQVLGAAKVLDRARVEDHSVVRDAVVRDDAVVSGHALVCEQSVVSGRAKVRGHAVVKAGSTVTGDARVLEHAVLATRKTCGDHAVVKGVASVYGGNQRGTAMIDGFYAKGNEITRGKWFTWSWGQGKNAGEIDEEFGGVYADYTFDRTHPWMAWDEFGVTWGYLVNDPRYEPVAADAKPKSTIPDTDPTTEYPNHALVLNGEDQFVELPADVADLGGGTYTAEFMPDAAAATAGAAPRLFEFSAENGDALWLCPDDHDKLVFAIRKGDTVELLSAPAAMPGAWTSVQVVLDGSRATLLVNGTTAAVNERMTLRPDDVRATRCYLGRGAGGGHFAGRIDRFTVHAVPLLDRAAPAPDPAAFELPPQFLAPGRLLLSAVPGTDVLGVVEYWFEEEGGKWNSGWAGEPALRLERPAAAGAVRFRVKMRDKLGNETAFSPWAAPLSLRGARVFEAGDGAPTLIEAEHFARSVAGADGSKWETVTAPAGFVGDGAIQALPDRNLNHDPPSATAPRVDYLVDFTQPGRYFVRLRNHGANHDGDSVYLGLDLKVEPWGNNVGMHSGRHTWGERREFHVDQPGIRTFSIWMREDGASVDRILIHRDPDYEPDPDRRDPDKSLIGPGPAASASRVSE